MSRNIGVSWSGAGLNQRATWSIGWFNDSVIDDGSLRQNGNDITARVTALPVLADDGTRYLHVAVSTGALRMRAACP